MSARAKSDMGLNSVLIERVLLGHRGADVRYDCW
jgi:hypothetical protein